VKGVDRKVTKEMLGGDDQALKDLGKIKFFPDTQFGTLNDLGVNRHRSDEMASRI
jgi:hypothetical protein